MSMDIEQLLRDGMERCTRDLSVPAGLGRQAVGQYQRRRHRVRVAMAVGTAAVVVAGVAVAGVAGAASPGAGQPLQTTAYVIGRVERALSPSGQYRLIAYTRTRYSPGFSEAPMPENSVTAMGPPNPRSPWQIGTEVSWQYQLIRREAAFNAAGQPVFDYGLSNASGTPVTVAVIYRNHTWWRTSGAGPAHRVTPDLGPSAVTIEGVGYIRRSPSWRVTILRDLTTHQYRIAGHQRVDGVNALKLVAPLVVSGTRDAIWVNPATYLPVRTQTILAWTLRRPFRVWTEESDFRWLKPTPASLARLNVRIPAGFTRVQAP